MKPHHALALSCFVVAIVLYVVGWRTGAVAVVVLGAVVEAVGWVRLFAGEDDDGR
ncbi:MAG TPA: hypothetical protein VFL14_11705 [Xanthomonadales bacterium]|nr:hypothetical protein [Xanthomonadales bacterium]